MALTKPGFLFVEDTQAGGWNGTVGDDKNEVNNFLSGLEYRQFSTCGWVAVALISKAVLNGDVFTPETTTSVVHLPDWTFNPKVLIFRALPKTIQDSRESHYLPHIYSLLIEKPFWRSHWDL